MFSKPRMLTPGPTPIPEEVRLILAQDMIHHRKAEFKKTIQEINPKLQLLFGTKTEVLTLTSSGTGSMVAAIHSLFDPQEKVLVINGGIFGNRWKEIAVSHDLNVVEITVQAGRSVNPELIEEILEQQKDISGVLVQLSETSTGVEHPIKAIAAITSKTNALLIVDGISGVGITPCPMDDWQVDCLVTGSQKGLMLPPGLAFVALSKRAWEKADRVKTPNFYFNLIEERKAHLNNQTSFTPAIGLIVALNRSLDVLLEDGLDSVFKKQLALTSMTRTGVKAMGLELFVKDIPARGLTSVCVPAGFTASKILSEAHTQCNVIMAAGQAEYAEKIIRIGHMGWVDWADICAGLHSLYIAITNLGGHIDSKDYLEQSLSAYWQALKSDYIF